MKNGQRDRLHKGLSAAGIGAAVYYPLSLHLQECFADLGHKEGDFPVSEEISKEILALPIYPESSAEQRAYVVSSIEKILLEA